MRYILWIGLSVLSACAAAPQAPLQPVAGLPNRGAQIAAECALLEEAHARLTQAGRPAPIDIVVGCPGRQGLVDQMPLKQQSAALRQANAAVLPAALRSYGPRAERIYRRMISRGVPVDLASQLATESLFRAASAGN